MIFTVFMKDGSKYSYDCEKYCWYFRDNYFYVRNNEKEFVKFVCHSEEIVKVIVEGDEL